MLAICIATLTPASWLAVEAPPPSVILLLLLLLLLSPLSLLRTSSGTALPMLPVCECVFLPRAALSGTVVAIACSH